jgi:hypothetical protein
MNPTTLFRDFSDKAKGLIEAGSKHTKKGLATATLVGASFLPTNNSLAQDGFVNLTSNKTNSAEVTTAELAGKTKAITNRSLSENPLYVDYKAKVRMEVDKALPNNIPDRDKTLNIFAGSITDQVLRGPEDFTNDEFSKYVNKIYNQAMNDFKGDISKLGSIAGTLSYVQGTRSENGNPSGNPIFTQVQLDRLFDYHDYNVSLRAAGSALGGMTQGGKTSEQMRSLSDKLLNHFLVPQRELKADITMLRP